MIYGATSELATYFPSEVTTFILEVLRQAKTEFKPGRYEYNEKLYASVDEYHSKPQTEGRYETHNRFCDIQMLIAGEEYIYLSPRKELRSATEYNRERDITFYGKENSEESRIKLSEGTFLFLDPEDGHMPQIEVKESTIVKKVVIKIEHSLS